MVNKKYQFNSQNLLKCGRDLDSNPSGTRCPLNACCPTQAII